MIPPSKPEREVRSFADTLADIDGGRAHGALSRLLNELTQAVIDTGRKGTLAVTVEVAPLAPGNVENLLVTVKPVLKAPNDNDRQAVFFTDKNANLTREDPTTSKALPLKAVQDPSATNVTEIRKAN